MRKIFLRNSRQEMRQLVLATVLHCFFLTGEFSAENIRKTRIVGGAEFVWIPGGSFVMGQPKYPEYEKKWAQHTVMVDGFWMSKYEVTQEQYEEVMGENPSYHKKLFGGGRLPVENVSWDDVIKFCRRFSEKYEVVARLPYEAEWEYAYRAGTNTRYYWGDKMDDDYGWAEGNSGNESHDVGLKKPNAFGLFDMSGNVDEWCMDSYEEDYYQNSPKLNPKGPEKDNGDRVLRGGSWGDDADLLTAASRGSEIHFQRFEDNGFRLVIEARSPAPAMGMTR